MLALSHRAVTSTMAGALAFAGLPALLTAQRPARPATPAAAAAPAITPAAYQGLTWRHIGPEGNRFTSAAGIPGDPLTYYVGAASGGIWKTSDGGTTWASIFDDQPVQSIGALAIARSDANIVWAGTGEAHIRSHISVGEGIFKSTDAGRRWTRMGLEKTGRIARIVIHPTDPNVVLACALGHAYGPQPERGVYRTSDGGATWTRVLHVDEHTGCSDLAMDPRNPRILFAGMWQLEIRTWGRTSGGPGSGLFTSRDGGVTWQRLTGRGLPTGPVGKVAVAIAPSNPDRVYALIETGDGLPWNGQPTESGALWRTDDGGANWQRLEQNLPLPGPRYVSDLVPSFFADDRVYLTVDGHRSDDFATYVFVSNDRGATWRDLGITLPSREPCYAIMEDPRNEDLLYLGTEYGAYASFDRGERWFPLGAELPTVAVRDLFVQDRDSDLIAATHGRGVFALDVEALRQVTRAVARKPAHLFAVEPAILWRMQSRGWQGQKNWHAKNPPYGATFHVWLAEAPKDKPVLTVHDVTGAEVARVEGKAEAGLQAIQWDARVGRNQLAAPGAYAVRWQGMKDVEARAFQLLPDPATTAAADGADAASAKE